MVPHQKLVKEDRISCQFEPAANNKQEIKRILSCFVLSILEQNLRNSLFVYYKLITILVTPMLITYRRVSEKNLL